MLIPWTTTLMPKSIRPTWCLFVNVCWYWTRYHSVSYRTKQSSRCSGWYAWFERPTNWSRVKWFLNISSSSFNKQLISPLWRCLFSTIYNNLFSPSICFWVSASAKTSYENVRKWTKALNLNDRLGIGALGVARASKRLRKLNTSSSESEDGTGHESDNAENSVC